MNQSDVPYDGRPTLEGMRKAVQARMCHLSRLENDFSRARPRPDRYKNHRPPVGVVLHRQ